MRIVYIIGQLRKGGAEQQLYHLVTHLDAEITVIVMEQNLDDGYWVEPMRQQGIEVVEIDRNSSWDIHRLLTLRRLLIDKRPDIVHIFADNPSAIYGRVATLLGPQTCVIGGVRSHPRRDPRWFYLLKRHVLNHFLTALIANSQVATDHLVENRMLPPDRIFYIPNGIDLDRFRCPQNLTWPDGLDPDWQGRLIVGNVSSLKSVKNPLLFVQVASNVLAQLPDVRFLYVGKGPMMLAAQQMAQDCAIADKVHFVGERHDIPILLHQMAVFLMTSNYEGTSNAAMEAMAAGLPCVLTDTGDCRFLVHHDVTGYIAPVGDEDALTQALLALLRDDGLRMSMGQNATEKIKVYSIDQMAKQYMAIYQRIASIAL